MRPNKTTTGPRLIILTVLLLLPRVVPAQRIATEPKQPAPPTLSAARQEIASAVDGTAARVQTQIVPFLGIATTQTMPEQRAQVHLPEGVGLTVQKVMSESPAARAGLQKYDVLHKFNDQLLVNDPQFRVLLRLQRGGDKIKLTVIRRTIEIETDVVKPTVIRRPVEIEVDVVLDQKEVPVANVPPHELVEWLLLPSSSGGLIAGRPSLSNYEDDKHVLVLTDNRQGRHLLAKDKQGAVLFDGPIDTRQQRQGIPGEILPKLKTLETPPKRKPAAERPS